MKKLLLVIFMAMFVAVAMTQPAWSAYNAFIAISLLAAVIFAILTFSTKEPARIFIGVYVVGYFTQRAISQFLFHQELGRTVSWFAVAHHTLNWFNIFIPLYLFWKTVDWSVELTRQNHWLQGILFSSVFVLMLGFEPSLNAQAHAGMLRLGFLGMVLGSVFTFKVHHEACSNKNIYLICFMLKASELSLTYLQNILVLTTETQDWFTAAIVVCSLSALGLMLKQHLIDLIQNFENSFVIEYRKLNNRIS